jgi:hypothetical protein
MRRSSATVAVALSFLAFLAAGGARAALISVDIGLNPTYLQTGPSMVVTTGGFFAARAFTATPNDFNGGEVFVPGGSSGLPLAPVFGQSLLSYSQSFPTQSSLNAAFSFGSYNFAVTNSVTRTAQSAVVRYTAAADPLSIPQLTATSYSQLQNLNVGTGFTFDFNTFIQNPNANQAYVFLNIFNSATGTEAFSRGFLAPTTTSIFMPGGTLTAGQSYTFDLLFDERIVEGGAGMPPGALFADDMVVPGTIFFDAHTDGTFTTSAVPEPGLWSMLVLGVGGLGARLRRRARATVLA